MKSNLTDGRRSRRRREHEERQAAPAERSPARQRADLEAEQKLPLVAIVGRPNVGKSTLFNRLTRTRRAIVGDEPGITRDRLYGMVRTGERPFRLVDTGGILPDDADIIPEAIFRQARVAIEEAVALLFIVDARTPLAAPDMQLAKLLLKTGKPIFLLANKVDSARQEEELAPFYRLGISELLPISAEHGLGIGAVLEALEPLLPADAAAAGAPKPSIEAAAATAAAELANEVESEAIESGEVGWRSAAQVQQRAEIRVAIVGRPNVGKSTLLNRLIGEERAIVSSIAGTTRDAVDAVVEHNGIRFRFVDTAGIRRKGKTRLMAEKLSVVMARKHLEQADVALVLVDAAEGPVALDATIAGYAAEAAKACILVVNKWDLAREKELDRREMEENMRDTFKFLAYAPLAFISAENGKGTDKLFDVVERVARERRRRVATGEMNRFLRSMDFDRAPVPAGQRVKVYYMSQVDTEPPTFVLFVDKPRPLHFSFRRFLENHLRRAFGFEGSPIVIRTRVSE